MAAAIEIEDLVKDYPSGFPGLKLRAVDGVNLRVERGEIFGLLGPNGSGKSTTIKILLGLAAPSAGRCRVFGRPAGGLAARASVGFLPEAPHFPRFLSGRELLRYYARVCGVGRGSLEERCARALREVGLEDAADRRIGTYSKGMLQRIGLAQALVHEPELVLLDEPTAGVDPVGAASIASIARDLRERGTTILVSSHLLPQMEDLCDRVAILHRGRVVAEGAVDELVRERDAESWVVDPLEGAGREAVEAALRAHGSALRRVERPKLGLDAAFLRALRDDDAAETEETP